MRDTRDYEILYDQPAGDYSPAEVGGIRTRTIRAGDSLEVEAFPITRITQEARRELARRRSSPAQERLNERNAVKRIRRLAEANFTEQDLFVTLTFDYGLTDSQHLPQSAKRREIEDRIERGELPEDEADARKLLKNYLKRVRRRIAVQGGDPRDLKYIYVIEASKEPRDGDFDSLPTRYHYHLLLHAPGLTRDEIEALWDRGYAQTKRLDFRDNGLDGLTKYISKQFGRTKRNARRWAHSKNLTEPVVTVSNRKISRHRARRIAEDVQANARAVFEAIYPGYALEGAGVRFSDFVAGAYIYARLRRAGADRGGRSR